MIRRLAALGQPRLAVGLLILLALASFLPGQTSLPPVDRDEARFAQASRQMVETGDLVDIRLQDQPRHKKPVGIYWLQAASAAVLGEHPDNPIWPYRLPSLIGAIMAVLLTFGMAREALFRLLPPDRAAPAALFAAALMGTSVIVNVEARLAKTDAMLLVTVLAAQWALMRAWLDGRLPRRWALLFWIAQGIGILIKGPLTAMVTGLTVVALCLVRRDVRWLGHLHLSWGPLLAGALAAAWLVPITIRTEGAFFMESVVRDMLAKVPEGQEGHGAPPGYHALFFWLAFWPGAIFAGLAIPWVWRQRAEPVVIFLLAWALPVWIAFELIATKLMHYTMPAYPAVAILAAGAWCTAQRVHLPRWGLAIVAVLAGLISLTLAGVFIAFGPLVDGRIDGFGLAAGLILLSLTGLFLWRAARGGRLSPPVIAIAAALLSYSLIFGGLLPRAETPWISRAIARAVPETQKPVAVAGFREASIVLMLGTDTRLIDGAAAARALADDRSEIAVVSQKEAEAFEAAGAALGLRLSQLAAFEGFNYANGDPYQIAIYRLAR